MVWTLPIAPSRIHSTSRRQDSKEWPWLPICVTTLCSLATLAICGTRGPSGPAASRSRRACRASSRRWRPPRGYGRAWPPPRRRSACPSRRASCGSRGTASALGWSLKVPRGVAPVHVAQGDDVVAAGDGVDVAPAHPADADAGDVQLLAGRRLAAAGHGVTRHNGCNGGCTRRSLKKFTTPHFALFHDLTPDRETGHQPGG